MTGKHKVFLISFSQLTSPVDTDDTHATNTILAQVIAPPFRFAEGFGEGILCLDMLKIESSSIRTHRYRESFMTAEAIAWSTTSFEIPVPATTIKTPCLNDCPSQALTISDDMNRFDQNEMKCCVELRRTVLHQARRIGVFGQFQLLTFAKPY